MMFDFNLCALAYFSAVSKMNSPCCFGRYRVWRGRKAPHTPLVLLRISISSKCILFYFMQTCTNFVEPPNLIDRPTHKLCTRANAFDDDYDDCSLGLRTNLDNFIVQMGIR